MGETKEFITVAPKMSSYEHWHDQAAALIRRANPEIGDYQTLIFPTAVNGFVGSIRADTIYLHPDVSDHPPQSSPENMDQIAAWFTTELACRLGPEAQIQFLAIAEQEDPNSDTSNWTVFFKDASKFLDGQRGIYDNWQATEKVG